MGRHSGRALAGQQAGPASGLVCSKAVRVGSRQAVGQMSRYGLYFAPAAGGGLWNAGCIWLGRDPESGVLLQQPGIEGVPPARLAQLTASARRYGFHATVKAPFRLAGGFTERDLLATVAAWCGEQVPVVLPALQVRRLDRFLALVPHEMTARVTALTMDCVAYVDGLRAPATATELARRRAGGLSARQEVLLLRWGYPHTEEAYRLHLTLSDALDGVDEDTIHRLHEAASVHFKRHVAAAQTIAEMAVFREPEPGAALSVLARIPFGVKGATPV